MRINTLVIVFCPPRSLIFAYFCNFVALRWFYFFMLQLQDIISSDPQVQGGTPCFSGTRVPVEILIHHLLDGDLEDFYLDFPSVEVAQVEALIHIFQQMVDQAHGKVAQDSFR